ncbi:MAG TPA: hypothetical protein VFM94_09380 [Solirubrobacterales bacterium]|nr:hypothetical protein [Solirubrobacterales bacterium]
MNSTLTFLAAAIAVALVALAGCGGDGEGGSSGEEDQGFTVRASTTMTTGKLPKAKFVRQVNKICRESWVTIRENFIDYSGWGDQGTDERKRIEPVIRLSLMAGIDFHIFDNIHFLGAPKGEERDIEEIIGPLQEAVERGQRLGPLHSFAEVEELFSDYNRQASRYGLEDCLVDRSELNKIKAQLPART